MKLAQVSCALLKAGKNLLVAKEKQDSAQFSFSSESIPISPSVPSGHSTVKVLAIIIAGLRRQQYLEQVLTIRH